MKDRTQPLHARRVRGFQTPFGITACESSISVPRRVQYKRAFQTPFGITACERLRESLSKIEDYRFQTPFGITACESKKLLRYDYVIAQRFKRLSASLHVKVSPEYEKRTRLAFQTPFGITACERTFGGGHWWTDCGFKRLSASLHVKVKRTSARICTTICVSNAFRHHCM